MSIVCGIDEAGRGCGFGSLFVCGVACEDIGILESYEVKDSKKLSFSKRNKIALSLIESNTIKYHLCKFGATTIDTDGLSHCLKSALIEIRDALQADIYYMDGNTTFGVENMHSIIKGDDKIKQISAASIIAKYHKDAESIKLDKLYPEYNIAKNKGYLSKEHIQAIEKYGYTEHHRKSYKIRSLAVSHR